MRKTYSFFTLIIFIIIILISACTQNRTAWKGRTETENGVTVIKNPGQPIYTKAILSLKEDLSLGAASGDEFLFSVIKELDVDDQENIYVLDWKEAHVLVFDRNGRHLRTIGRRGQGPGEFQRPMDISIFGNQIVVHDLERCLSFFTLDGKFIRSITSVDILGIWDVYCDSKGNIICHLSIFDPKNPKFLFRKYRTDMNLVCQFAESPRPGYSPPYDIFAPLPSMTIDQEDNIVFGYPEDYTIQVFNPEGKLIKKIEREYQPVGLSNEDKKEMKEENPGIVKIEYPKHKPAFRSFFADDEGRLYVGTWEKAGRKDIYIYDIFDNEGRYLARIPIKKKPLVGKKGKLYAIEEDEDGFQSLKRYQMTWKKF